MFISMKKIKRLINYMLESFTPIDYFSIYREIPEIELGDFESDKKAIASDWKAVGDDMRKFINIKNKI